MRNFLYLCYFFLRTNYTDLKASFNCCKKKGYNKIKLFVDMTYCTLKYGSSFVDYFNFRFYEKKNNERKAYATMGYMYRFHKKVNDQLKIKELVTKENLKYGIRVHCKYYLNSFQHNSNILNPNIFSFQYFGMKRIIIEYIHRKRRNLWRKHFKTPDGMLLSKNHKMKELLLQLAEVKKSPNSTEILELSCHPSKSFHDLQETEMMEERVVEYDILISKDFSNGLNNLNLINFSEI